MTFEEIYQLQKNGQLQEAKQGYLDFLKEFPGHAEAWHMLAIGYAEEGNFNEAIEALQTSLQLDASNPSVALHLANVFKAKGDYLKATNILQDLIQRQPKFAAAYNNLGTIYYAQKQYQFAIDAFQMAIDLQSNFVDAYYNLGLAYSKNSKMKETMSAYQAVLELSPHHPGAMFQVATLLMQQEKYSEAISYLQQIEANYPFHFETQSNLAVCYLKLGKLAQAKQHYEKALGINEQDLQVLFNLGVIEMQLSDMQSATKYYMRALAINPNFVEAHNNIAIVYLNMKNRKEALKHFCEVLRLQSDNPSVKHTIDILNHKANVSHSPPEYIQTLFDSYADHYDSHLTGPLAYQVPRLLYDAFAKYLTDTTIDILDLGTGTGLSGEVFRPYAKQLVGVDLSEKMLAAAAQKHIYDELIQADILTYLSNAPAKFDLIVAADVIVYFGELDELLKRATKVLKPQGFFIFNTEVGDTKDFELTVTGRFTHNQTYVRRLAAENGLSVLVCEMSMLRKHQEEEVQGYIFVLQKQT